MHERPDGDTIACSLAFAEVLEQLGKSVVCVCKDAIPKPFQFLEGSKQIQSDFLSGDYEVMIVLDCGDLRRTGFPARVREFASKQGTVIHIDHHQKSDLYKLANLRIFDPQAAATGEILFRLFNLLPVTITPSIATCLLTSLYYDTGAFKHANTGDTVLKIAAQLLHLGARLKDITEHVELTKSVPMLKLWGIALARSKRHPKYCLVSSLITRQDIADCGACDEDVAGIVNLLNTVPGSRAAMLLYESKDGQLHGSLRTEQSNVDVSALASVLGGGGLRKASGFSLPGKIVMTGTDWHVKLGY